MLTFHVAVCWKRIAEEYFVMAGNALEAKEKAVAEFRNSFSISEAQAIRLHCKIRAEKAQVSGAFDKTVPVN